MNSAGVRILSVVMAVAVLGVAGSTWAADFRLPPGGLNQVIFQSDAPLETITGTSNGVSGQVSVDLANPSAASGRVVVDVASFRTGIDMRDEHLRGETWLDATAHPEIVFELTGVTVPAGTTLQSATPVAAELTGNLTLRGVTLPVSTTAEVTYYELDAATREAGQMTGLTNNALRIEGELAVTLADYHITVPPVLNLKVAETVTILLRLTGVQE